MEGLYVCVILCIAATTCVLGASVNLTLSDPSPTQGSNPVVMTCIYSTTMPGEQIKVVYMDKFKSQHYGYTTLVKHTVATGNTEWIGDGADLQNRASVVVGNGTMTLTLKSVTCDDTTRYKCDVTPDMDRHELDYFMDTESLNVKDSSGKVCGGAQSTVYSLSTILFILLTCSLLR